MGYLIDTNVVAEIRKGQRCNPGVAAWFAAVSEDDTGIRDIFRAAVRPKLKLEMR